MPAPASAPATPTPSAWPAWSCRSRRGARRRRASRRGCKPDGVGHLAQVRVAVRELGPRVGDADHGAAVEDVIAEALALQPRAMHEAVEVLTAEPVAAPERV